MHVWATTMAATFAALTALPVLADEKSFFHVPGVTDFRLQEIARSSHEGDAWPFTVDRGWLACAYVTGQPTVYFSEIVEESDEDEPRVTIVSTELTLLMTGAVLGEGLFPRTTTIEEMGNTIRLMGPFEAMGKRLCEQPPGVVLGTGEL